MLSGKDGHKLEDCPVALSKLYSRAGRRVQWPVFVKTLGYDTVAASKPRIKALYLVDGTTTNFSLPLAMPLTIPLAMPLAILLAIPLTMLLAILLAMFKKVQAGYRRF